MFGAKVGREKSHEAKISKSCWGAELFRTSQFLFRQDARLRDYVDKSRDFTICFAALDAQSFPRYSALIH